MTYDQAIDMFRRANPTIDPFQNNQAFNTWSYNTFGPNGYEGATYVPATGTIGQGIPGDANATAVNLFNDAAPALSAALSGAAVNPNTQQVQGGAQTGAYQSTGGTTTAGTQTTDSSRRSDSSEQQTGKTIGSFDKTGTTAGQQAAATTEETAGATTMDQLAKTLASQRGTTEQQQTGTTAQQQAGTSAQQQTGTTAQQQTGTSAQQQTGTTAQQQTGQTTSDIARSGSGVTTSNVVDTLGLGNLLTASADTAMKSDAVRNAFLQNLVSQGPANQKALTAAAVNQALSGPAMYGAGINAQNRAAGTAASLVGLNSLNQQLQAAQELAGGSAVTNLVAAGNPYLGRSDVSKTSGTESALGTSAGTTSGQTTGTTTGQTTNNLTGQTTGETLGKTTSDLTGQTTGQLSGLTTGTNTGETSTTSAGTTAGSRTGTNVGTTAGTTSESGANTSVSDLAKTANSLDISKLLNTTTGTTSENQSGTSSNQGVTAGIGTVPQSTTGGGGGCVACTAYVDMGWQMHRAIRAAATWKINRPEYRRSLAGYSVYGPSLARAILRSALFAKLFFPIAKAVLFEELRLAGRTSKRRLFAKVCHAGFHYGSLAVAVLTGRTEIKQCDSETVNMLSRNNLYLKV